MGFMTLRFLRVLSMMAVAVAAATAFAASPRFDLKLDKLEEQLNLTPEQKEQYDVAVGATKRMMMQMALVALQAKEKLAEELAKPKPDFGVLAELRRSIVEDGKTLRREARDEWRKLYGMLTVDQVATLRRFFEDQADQVGMLHELISGLVLGR